MFGWFDGVLVGFVCCLGFLFRLFGVLFCLFCVCARAHTRVWVLVSWLFFVWLVWVCCLLFGVCWLVGLGWVFFPFPLALFHPGKALNSIDTLKDWWTEVLGSGFCFVHYLYIFDRTPSYPFSFSFVVNAQPNLQGKSSMNRNFSS